MPPQGANARPLPKFGEWDVNNPASGEGFTVIFNKARDQKKTSGLAVRGNGVPVEKKNNSVAGNNETKKDEKHKKDKNDKKPNQKKLLCCFYGA